MGSFSIVPVLDLRYGAVVRARAGDRASYRPIETPLAPGSEPAAVLDGLLALAPFRRFYIADLDAIEGRGNQRAIIAALARRHGGIEFWVDAGLATAAAAAELAGAGLVPVLGSETLASADELTEATRQQRRSVLSLDYRGEAFVGPAAVAAEPALWPDRVIVMTLARIGGDAGPDFTRLGDIQQRAGGRAVFAAGGVRGTSDVARLASLGIAGALVASALHDGRLDRASLAAQMTER